ncbi:MAG: bifunctional phosphoribosylaminoimidazolecarboxamide formyltransferase/IMP cyclohydrolase, partial [Pyrinomonadaceae bacterium]
IEVRDVSDVTGFPEMMDGRIKTLHPRIHGALLGLRNNPVHEASMREHDIEPIDMVVINLYPFEETIARKDVTMEQAIEQIDIGGPAMIRSAAKNFRDVAVVTSGHLYGEIVKEMSEYHGALTSDTRQKLSAFAFTATFIYDANISRYLTDTVFANEQDQSAMAEQWPPSVSRLLHKDSDLRYGENPHQKAALYKAGEDIGVTQSELLSGKEMSFNNYVDADAAWELVSDFGELTCAIIKHTNPAGVGQGASSEEAYRRALETDPVSAFGGIVAFNREVDAASAKAVVEIFTEVVVAPGYETEALEIFKTKKSLRVLQVPTSDASEEVEYRQISGGMLLQTRDTYKLTREDLKVASKRQPTAEEIEALLFAWTVCKHTKSNAIVYARAGQTVGVGAGQMSRVDSVRLGAMRAQLPLAGSVLASDAFFPFRDGIDEAAQHGITAVIQPGGSMRDAEVIAAVDEHGLAMVFTGVRHFKH